MPSIKAFAISFAALGQYVIVSPKLIFLVSFVNSEFRLQLLDLVLEVLVVLSDPVESLLVYDLVLHTE